MLPFVSSQDYACFKVPNAPSYQYLISAYFFSVPTLCIHLPNDWLFHSSLHITYLKWKSIFLSILHFTAFIFIACYGTIKISGSVSGCFYRQLLPFNVQTGHTSFSQSIYLDTISFFLIKNIIFLSFFAV